MQKQSQLQYQDAKYVADQIRIIIRIMLSRMSPEAQMKAGPNLANKIKNFNAVEISNKKSPGGSAIGVSMSLVKNILNGRDPYFVALVIDELARGV